MGCSERIVAVCLVFLTAGAPALGLDTEPPGDGRVMGASTEAMDPAGAPGARAEDALGRLREAAELGSAEAQNQLGVNYDRGIGVPPDPREAAEWFRAAAEQGYAPGQFNLGLANDRGRGVPEDPEAAALWLRRAAEQGYAEAQNSLGFFYAAGRGVPPDPTEAARWYRAAAAQGLARAEHNLGYMYDMGLGVERDAEEAARWYRRAAEQGLARAQVNLAILYSLGDGVQVDLAEAFAWYDAAASGLEGRERRVAARARDAVARQMGRTELERAFRLAAQRIAPASTEELLAATDAVTGLTGAGPAGSSLP